ncbi:MAG: hypothetical protein QME85_04460 [Candidatus Saccharicenans sp.]|nr:hypothetical protein [Candidatus Saccharicenans sp.]MDI6848517.1 hypothetical protein [Candidatus Saccharicenans sp.]
MAISFFRKNARRARLLPGLMLIFLVTGSVSCDRPEDKEQAWSWPQPEVQEETRPVTAPVPKISEEIYVDITARAAVIFDKYKEDLDEAHRQMDLVYQKYGITFQDYDRYRRSLTSDNKRRLEKLIQERIQKVHKEYF